MVPGGVERISDMVVIYLGAGYMDVFCSVCEISMSYINLWFVHFYICDMK